MRSIINDKIILSGQIFWLLTMIFLSSLIGKPLQAQGIKIGPSAQVINEGARIVLNNANLVNQGTLKNQTGGKITLTGNWQNDQTFTGANGSEVVFNGAATQQIGGSKQTTFGNLTLNNNAGFTLSKSIEVEGTLNFQNGLLTALADTLKMGSSGTIVNANENKYVNGKLAFWFNATGSRLFTTGKGGSYLPVTFSYTGLSGNSLVTMEQFETALSGQLPVNTTLLPDNRYWQIGQQGGSNLAYFVSLPVSGITPVNPVVILKKDGSLVTSVPTTTPAYTNATAFTSFSEFALAEQCPTHLISGYAAYENNPNTRLAGLKIILQDGNTPVDSVITGATGYYQFTNISNGSYKLTVKSAHPSGQWQTWGGVNNTDYLLVSKHIAGTQFLPVDPPVVKVSASTKIPHPAITLTDANAIRQAAKFPLTGWQYFDIPKWVFSGLDASNSLDDIEVACSDITRDIRGLCAGDVNGTYVPAAGYKMAEPGLELVHEGVLAMADEMIFPVRVDRDMEIGAITLYLDYDPSVMVVTDVTFATTVTNSPELWFNVPEPTLNLKPETLNTLQIGWMSTEPISVVENETVLLIHARLTKEFRISHFTFSDSRFEVEDLNVKPEMRNVKCEIRFALNDNLLSEIADADGNVIDGLKLSIPDADGNSEIAKWRNSEILVYPNPANETLNLKLETLNLKPSTLNLELLNLQATKVWGGETQTIGSGWNEFQVDVSDLAPGIYFLRANVGGEILMKKVVISR